MTRFSPGSVRSTVGGWVSHYRELQLAERIVYTAWSAALLATLLGLVGVSTYQVAAAQPQTERCTVTAVSPTYSTLAGTHYRVVDTSCGKYQIAPGNSATSALEPVAADSIALTGNPESGRSYLLTFRGWGGDRTLVSARSR
ncbi:MAG: hypothetical protein QOH69_340 [Actinomycetota bacterium]|jgi:hypothetical protein|nr:hypothetical protein [Actinomycetota bacterium]